MILGSDPIGIMTKADRPPGRNRRASPRCRRPPEQVDAGSARPSRWPPEPANPRCWRLRHARRRRLRLPRSL